MRWKGWDRVELMIQDPMGLPQKIPVNAIAPVIVSASRSTDIPAFYGDWFLNRLAAGYVKWRSPFGGEPVYVSFAKTRVFAFWSKNPAPFIQNLDVLDRNGYGYFFLVTLNDYERERMEPGIPALSERIRTFCRLSERIGAGRVIWRYDPLLLSGDITTDDLLKRIGRIGNRIFPYTRKLVISFIDIAKYGKVQRNLAASGFKDIREFSDREAAELAEGLSALNERWNLSISACGEQRDLSRYGIEQGQCIGYDMLKREFSDDPAQMGFLTRPEPQSPKERGKPVDSRRYFKDPGQRTTCGCVVSKDIGQYSTCPHGCVYCYANTSATSVNRNYRAHIHDAARGIFRESIV